MSILAAPPAPVKAANIRRAVGPEIDWSFSAYTQKEGTRVWLPSSLQLATQWSCTAVVTAPVPMRR